MVILIKFEINLEMYINNWLSTILTSLDIQWDIYITLLILLYMLYKPT